MSSQVADAIAFIQFAGFAFWFMIATLVAFIVFVIGQEVYEWWKNRE